MVIKCSQLWNKQEFLDTKQKAYTIKKQSQTESRQNEIFFSSKRCLEK